MNYKLNKLICSVAIVSSIMPLSACQKKTDDITLSRKDELIHLINPLDWNDTPDYVNLKLKDNYIIMDIDTFYRLLNNKDKDFIINVENDQIILDKKNLKEQMEMEFREYNTPSFKDYLKIIITVIEGTIIFIIGNNVLSFIEKPKEKIKKIS